MHMYVYTLVCTYVHIHSVHVSTSLYIYYGTERLLDSCVHLDSMVRPELADDKPCYIFYRLDERNSYQNYLWVFMAYTPDNAKVSYTVCVLM